MVSVPSQSELFRLLPSVDELLREAQPVATKFGHAVAVEASRTLLEELRSRIARGEMSEQEVTAAVEGAPA